MAKVAKGDKVVTGQLIAEAGSFMSANIHAPVSGTVTAVDMVPNGQGLRQMMITIKREGDDWAEGIDRSETIVRECTLSAQEIVARIKDAGIVGMGGATFPTHVKLSIPPGKKAESLIINGVECEPYLTSDHRTMLEHGEELLVGVTILMKAIAVEKAYIGIENNKPDAIAHLRRLAQGYKGIEVVPLKVKYPQGGEKQLIAAITGREVPPPPALPIDVGAVVCNASTTYAVYQAVQKHKPLIERVVTITGKGVREPKNLAEALIINGVECEPYLTSDHRTMLEHGEELLVGVTILMKAIAVEKAYIGIENNKPDAIAHLRRLAQGYKGIEVVPLKVKYPQGGEKQLIVAITGREVPPPPALPIDVGAVVCNASTTYAVYQAVQKHKPLIERVVTITGKGVREPKNLLTRMGTPVEALIEAAGGLPADAGKVINGGPMMGRAMVNLASPVTKGCSGITVMSGRDAQRREASQCIKCAKCVAACPMGLEPYYLSKM
ncbi:RnfABCDGE type electron transport complex subunit C, partial [Alistipes onderdonkii]